MSQGRSKLVSQQNDSCLVMTCFNF